MGLFARAMREQDPEQTRAQAGSSFCNTLLHSQEIQRLRPGAVNTLLSPATRKEETQKRGRTVDAESDPLVSCL